MRSDDAIDANSGSRVSARWDLISADLVLGAPVQRLGPGNIPAGGDLRLDIPWDSFEQLIATIASGSLGLGQMKFRRYGLHGQAQHGIDLVGRRADGEHTVIQCKQLAPFSSATLRAAVETFADGRRPFDADHFVVAVSHPDARTTQVQEELAALHDEYQDEFQIELWGSDELNEILRKRADIVARFWSRETAETFCTGAPLSGVPAPEPQWTHVADQVLLSPLGVDGLERDVAEAKRLTSSDPSAAAEAYGRIADQLAADGFVGHGHVLRSRQLDALERAREFDASCGLAAQLAALALHRGDRDRARLLSHRLHQLVRASSEHGDGEHSAAAARHTKLIDAAVRLADHPLGDGGALVDALLDTSEDQAEPEPDYQPMLVLLLAENAAANDAVRFAAPAGEPADTSAPPDRPHVLHRLVADALGRLSATPVPNDDLLIRLRLVRAGYDPTERSLLLSEARQLRLPRPYAALVLAAEARRNALEGSIVETLAL